MNNKIILEVDKNLVDGEILIYKKGKLKSVEIHNLLPELEDIKANKNEINELKQTIANLAKIVKEK